MNSWYALSSASWNAEPRGKPRMAGPVEQTVVARGVELGGDKVERLIRGMRIPRREIQVRRGRK